MKSKALFLSLILSASFVAAARAQTPADLDSQASTMNSLAGSSGESKVIGKISNDFSSFLGSNSNAVVTGLRNGTPITLKSPTTTPGTGTISTPNTTVITPPTGQMGHGNVYISLALAKQQLGDLGITQPTPQQLQASLNGGTITQTSGTGANATTTTTELPGVLTMRSENMGWGQIAQKLGYKLGPVISSMKSANHSLAGNRQASTEGTTTSAVHGSKSRIVSGGGQSTGNSGHGITNGKGSSGSGIVSAAGRGSNGHSYGRSGGIVTGSGQSAGVSAGGGGHGNSGGGHGKGPSK